VFPDHWQPGTHEQNKELIVEFMLLFRQNHGFHYFHPKMKRYISISCQTDTVDVAG